MVLEGAIWGATDMAFQSKQRRSPRLRNTVIVVVAGALAALVALTLVTSLFTLLLITFIAASVAVLALDVWAKSRAPKRRN